MDFNIEVNQKNKVFFLQLRLLKYEQSGDYRNGDLFMHWKEP